MNHKGVCRTAPATPGLLNITVHRQTIIGLNTATHENKTANLDRIENPLQSFHAFLEISIVAGVRKSLAVWQHFCAEIGQHEGFCRNVQTTIQTFWLQIWCQKRKQYCLDIL